MKRAQSRALLSQLLLLPQHLPQNRLLSSCAVFLLTLRDPHCIVRDTWKVLEERN